MIFYNNFYLIFFTVLLLYYFETVRLFSVRAASSYSMVCAAYLPEPQKRWHTAFSIKN